MKLILKLILQTSKIRYMILFSIISMVLLTVASQLEIFALGVITKKGPDFFELFASQNADKVTKIELENRWNQLDYEERGYITKNDTIKFIDTKSKDNFIDAIFAKVNRYLSIDDNFLMLAIFLLIIAIFKALTLFLYRYNTKLISIIVSKELRQKYLEHIQILPMSFYHQYNIGSLSSRVVTDASQIANSINSSLINYIQTPFTVITTLSLCFITSWKLSMIMFFGFPIIIFPIFFIARRIKRISKQILSNQESFLSVLVDYISGIQTVKIFAMEDFSLKKYREQNEKLAHLEKRSSRYDVSARPIVHSIAMAFLSTALIYGLYVQNLSISEVVFFCGLLYVFYEPIKKFAEENNQIQRGLAAAERMYEILNLIPPSDNKNETINFQGFNEKIEFDNVWFKYEDKWILKGINFSMNKGEVVAIVGSTGAGKSTIAQLLPRLYEINEGEIRIDGISIKKYSKKSLRENISFVPQKSFLFEDSVATNISYGRSFEQSQIENAAIKAFANDFIVKLPQGYQTILAEAGKGLSGGQQQRLAIARALIKDAPILILDEATSSLDAISENNIKLAMHSLKGKVTQLIIAHRLSTIEDADKIVFIEDGKNIAQGTKEELLESCLQFRVMWEMMHRTECEVV